MTRMNYGKRFGTSVVSAKTSLEKLPPVVAPCVRFASDEQRMWWKSKADGTRNNKRNGISLMGKAKKQPEPDLLAAAELRMRDRMEQAVKLICFGLEELANVPPPKGNTRQRSFNQAGIIGLVNQLCFQTKIRMPELCFERKPGRSSSARNTCIDCGAEIRDQQSVELGTCENCTDRHRLLHQASERRREFEKERERMERVAKQLAKTIGKVERGIK